MPVRRTAAITAAALAGAGLYAGAVASPAAAGSTRMSTRYLLNHLAVRSEHGSGYDRAKFRLWVDADHDGCDTRDEVLIDEAVRRPDVGAGCTLSGGKWYSKYDGITTHDPSTFDIDHLVPLAEAWQSGAYRWTADTRERFANDLGYGASLIAVSAHSNRSKGDSEPQHWEPARTSYRCTYVARWVAVKWRWRLRVNSSEQSYLHAALKQCGWPRVETPRRANVALRSSGGGSGSTGSDSGGGVRITSIYFDSPGDDTGSNASLNAEWVRLKNTGSTAKQLSGWTLRDTSDHVYTFGSLDIGAGSTVTLHTGSGSDASANRYWDAGYYIWNNTGDAAKLRTAGGTAVDSCSYTSTNDPEVAC